MRIDVNIITKDRSTELALLLQTLLMQTYKDFDVWILDDGSGTPMESFYFISALIYRLKMNGHRVILQRNYQSVGVNRARQQLVDLCIEHGSGELILRQDDDTILDIDYLEKLVDGIKQGYDLVSSVTPMVHSPITIRESAHVKPVINRIVLDDEGKVIVNTDDCGLQYDTDEVILCDHFRSSALYKKKMHTEGEVDYSDLHSAVSFREEAFFSVRAILAGYKLGVHVGANAWHLRTPSGGERKPDYQQWAVVNQKIFNRLMRRLVKKHGNFIEEYHKKHLGDDYELNKYSSVNKNTNLLYHTDV